MQTTKAFARFSFMAALFAGSLATTYTQPGAALTSGDNGTHDPSRMIESEGKFWVYSTGGGSKWSLDGLQWTNGPRLFPNGFPDWLKTLLPSNQGVWAPDIIHLNGQYYLYYSVAATKACAIGLITSPTLNPDSKDYKWTDRGLVVSNDTVVKYATIDPAPILDTDGNLWVIWGGGYTNPTDVDSIWVTRMDNATGLPSPADPMKPGHPLLQGHKEGTYLHYHGGYYYVFWQTGGCCSGTASTYTIHMARSKAITGPYEGDKIFDASHGDVHGPGHIGIYSACGVERFTYHYYPSNGSILGENTLEWGADGWPVAGDDATTPLTPCGDPGSATAGSGSSGGSAGAAGNAGSSNAGATSAGSGGDDGGSATGGTGVVVTGGTDGTGDVGGSSAISQPIAGSSTAPSAGAATIDTMSNNPQTDAGCAYTARVASRSEGVVWLLSALSAVVVGRLRRKRAAR